MHSKNMTDTDENSSYFEINNAEISIDDPAWNDIAELEDLVASALTDEHLSILLTNDKNIQQLNKNFRDKDKPTNVLSFPADDEGEYMGDIAVAFETIKREAIEQDKSFHHHFIHMLIHGILHLDGYDHETDEEAEEMEALEIKILADMGIKNPYI
jgi:probable rRNA maturation factor